MFSSPFFPSLDGSACRWWAWTLIKGLTPEEALKVRAKVASLEALKGQRADLGLHRTWEGNYLVGLRRWSSVKLEFQRRGGGHMVEM